MVLNAVGNVVPVVEKLGNGLRAVAFKEVQTVSLEAREHVFPVGVAPQVGECLAPGHETENAFVAERLGKLTGAGGVTYRIPRCVIKSTVFGEIESQGSFGKGAPAGVVCVSGSVKSSMNGISRCPLK